MSVSTEMQGETKKVSNKPHATKFKSAKLLKLRKDCKHQHTKKDGLSSQKQPKQKFRCKDCGAVWTKPLAKKTPKSKKPSKVKRAKRNLKAN